MASPRRMPAPPAALLTHTPAPGLYSRLERAVEQLPKEVKTEGLENRLRKYPEGISGWELKPFMQAVEGAGVLGPQAGNPSVPRQFLLDLVHQNSPAFTHREGLLAEGGSLPLLGRQEDVWEAAGKIGSPTVVGKPQYATAAEDVGGNYRIHLLMQPKLPTSSMLTPLGSPRKWEGGHWGSHPNTIAHMRTKDVGDAIRLQEVQSDIRNQNVQHLAEQKEFYQDTFDPSQHKDLWPQKQVPLYDDYPEVLLKGLLLRAAHEGKRAIEIPPFDAISNYVSMRPSGIQHVYGGQVPGTLIRIGRPLGGLIDAEPQARGPVNIPAFHQGEHAYGAIQRTQQDMFDAASRAARLAGLDEIDRDIIYFANRSVRGAEDLHKYLQHRNHQLGYDSREMDRYLMLQMPEIMRQVELWHRARDRVSIGSPLLEASMRADEAMEDARARGIVADPAPAPSRRLEIPDSVRKRIIQGGIGLGVLAPLLQQDEKEQ